MPGIGNLPFPSFTLVLTSGPVVIPGPSVVRVVTPAFRATNNFMTTLRPHNKDIEEQQFLARFQNDSAFPVVHGDNATAMAVAEVEEVGNREEKLCPPSLRKRAILCIQKIVGLIFKPVFSSNS